MPARTPATAETTGTAANICDLVNDHAALIDGTLIDASIPANGTLRLTQSDGNTFDVDIPLFADLVISGLAITQKASPNLNQFDYTAGTVQLDAQEVAVSAGTLTFAAGDPTNPRVDIATIDSAGQVSVTQGTAAASPAQPATPAGELLLLVVYVEANASGSTGGYSILEVNAPTSGGATTNIAPGTDTGQVVAWNDTVGVWQPSPNVRLVRSRADLPPDDGKFITLEDGITYLVVGTVDIGNFPFKIGAGDNVSFYGFGAGVSQIVGDSNIFSSVQGNSLTLANLRLEVETPSSGSLDNGILALGGNLNVLRAENCVFVGPNSINYGITLNAETVGDLLLRGCTFVNVLTAVEMPLGSEATSVVLESCTNASANAEFCAVRMGSGSEVTGRVRLTTCRFNMTGTGGILDIDPYAVVPQNGIQINNCLFTGGGTYLVGVDPYDEISYFRDNIGISQTAIGSLSLSTGSTATSIGTAGTFVKANLGTTTAYFQDLFEQTSSNRLTYIGLGDPRTFDVDAQASVTVAGGGDSLSMTVYKNGSAIASMGTTSGTGGGTDPTSLATFGRVELAENDYLEIFVTNNTDTSSITVTRATLRVKEA